MTEQSVLVVEKDKQLSALVDSALSARGFSVLSFDSGAEGIKHAGKEMKLVVVGEQLSDIDGLGFIVKMRETNRKSALVFVAKQWRDPDFYRMLRDELKVDLVVHRPLRSSVFTAQIQALIGAGSVWSNADAAKQGEAPAAFEQEMPLPTVESHSAGQFSGGEFDKLRLRFLRSVPERLTKLETCLKSCLNGSYLPSVVEAAITLAHNLKGTALSWGFESLGRSSETMEAQLKLALGAPEETRKEVFQSCFAVFETMKKQSDELKSQNQHSDLQESTLSAGVGLADDEQDLSAAKVLLVSSEPPPALSGLTESGLALNFIHVSEKEAIGKAAEIALDAALIEIGSTGSSMGIARELRDLIGYENLPLGFISPPQLNDARADAAHAGSSLFVSKPLDLDVVQRVISQLISMREGGRFRVLVVDDDQDLASLTSRCLGQFGMITRVVTDPLTINQVLDEFSPDLILLDVNMPGISGFEVCRALRATARWRDVPILFLTAQTDLVSRLTAYEAGADDYLPKPVINVELLTRVKVRLERARELKERSERDLLTGLLLRRAFVEQAEALISECQRFNFHFSLCLLDVDHFKQVNDSHGHHAGDDVLITLGRLLRRRFRVEDLRGRWGGEEFILAFKHEQKSLMRLALSRIMEELKQIEFKGENGEVFHVTFSAGLSSFPDEAKTLQELTKVADRRLYLAKERGRKQIVIDD